MKKIIVFLAFMTFTCFTADAQSVLERVVDALIDNKKEDPTHKVIDAGGQAALVVPKRLLEKYDITYYTWSPVEYDKVRIVSSDKNTATIRGLRSTSSTIVNFKYSYKTFVDGKEKTENASFPFTITINKIAPTSITVDQEKWIGWGLEGYTGYRLHPEYAEAAMQFDSDNPNAVSINAQGKMYGVALGDAVITIRTDNGLQTSTHVECRVPSVSKLYIEGYDKKQKLYEGDELDLTYTFAPVHAEPTVKWYSSDNNIATVDQNGHVTFVGKGTVHIYCASTTNNVKTDIKLKPKKK